MHARRIAAVLSLAATVLAAPTQEKRTFWDDLESFVESDQTFSLTTEVLSDFSFDNWGGFDSLSNFDSFFGLGNYDGRFNDFNSVLVQEESVQIEEESSISVIQCESIDVNIIQEYISVLVEVMKELILEEICESEVQVIVSEQFISRMDSFVEDIRHVSSRSIGYDSHIASFLPDVVSSLQSRQFSDLGFSGSSIGNSLQSVSNNWEVDVSPGRVAAAWQASQLALLPASQAVPPSSII